MPPFTQDLYLPCLLTPQSFIGCYHGDNCYVIGLPEAEGSLGDGTRGTGTQGGSALEAEKFAVIGRFRNSVCEQSESIAVHKLKLLLGKYHVGIEAERQLGWAHEFFPVKVGSEMAGVGQDRFARRRKPEDETGREPGPPANQSPVKSG